MSNAVIKPTVYVETTVVSYLTARQSRDTIIAGHQQTTRDWWKTCHERFELFASLLVLQEASRGNPEAAQERLRVLNTLTLRLVLVNFLFIDFAYVRTKFMSFSRNVLNIDSQKHQEDN